MSRNEGGKVLLSISSLDCRSEETSKRSNQRGKEGNEELVDVHRLDTKSRNTDNRRQPVREGVELGLVEARNRAVGLIERTIQVRCLSISKHDDDDDDDQNSFPLH